MVYGHALNVSQSRLDELQLSCGAVYSSSAQHESSQAHDLASGKTNGWYGALMAGFARIACVSGLVSDRGSSLFYDSATDSGCAGSTRQCDFLQPLLFARHSETGTSSIGCRLISHTQLEYAVPDLHMWGIAGIQGHHGTSPSLVSSALL